MTDLGTEATARFSIRVAGRLGPLILSGLRRHGVVEHEWRPGTTSIDVCADADLVEVAERLTAHGLQIDSVRKVGDTEP